MLDSDRGVPDVGVDLHGRDRADRHGIEAVGQVMRIGRDDEAPPGYFVAE